MRNLKMIIWMPLLLLAAGCASNPKFYTWNDVTQLAGPGKATTGGLKVFTEEVSCPPDAQCEPRLSYRIFNQKGKIIQRVINHSQSPDLVELPPDQYVVVPETNYAKQEVIGATVKAGEITVIDIREE